MTRIFAFSDLHYQNTVSIRKNYNFSKSTEKKEAKDFYLKNDIFYLGKELAKISKKDDVLVLAGDYDFYELVPHYFKGFKGKKILILGNYDYWFREFFLSIDIQMNFWCPENRFNEMNHLYKIALKNYDKYFKRFEDYDIYGSYLNNYKQEIPKNIDIKKISKQYLNEKIKYFEENGFIVMENKLDPIEFDDCVIVADGLWYDYSFVKSKKVSEEKLKSKKLKDIGLNNDGRYIFGIDDKEFFDKKIKCYETQLIKAKKMKKPIISVSHVVPHRKLYDNRPGTYFFCAFLGSKKIHEINKKYGIKLHLFGYVHDYSPIDALKEPIVISGIKYVNVSLFSINHLKPVWQN
jgi:Icc-related predicted phosphoesterase